MSEDRRLALLLDAVAEFEALDDDVQDKFYRALAGCAALDAGPRVQAWWLALLALVETIMDGGTPPPVDAVKRVREALADVGWSELGRDVAPLATSMPEQQPPGTACWRAIAQLVMVEQRDREALERAARPSDPEDGWGGPTDAAPGETPDVEEVVHWDDDDTPEAASGG